jgi:hypothetical protein
VDEVRSAGTPTGDAPRHLDVRVRTKRTRGALEVSLLAPDEPLAWAIAAPFAEGATFETRWHAERTMGTRPVAAPLDARLDFSGQGALGVRVFGDDGSVGTTVVPLGEC